MRIHYRMRLPEIDRFRGLAIVLMGFVLAVGGGAIRTLLPLPSRDARLLLMLAVIFIVAPSFWNGRVRLQSRYSCTAISPTPACC